MLVYLRRVKGERGLPENAIRNELAADLSRREFIGRAGAFGLGAVVLGALPVAASLAKPEIASAQNPLVDPTLEAFFDTMIPGKPVPDLRTELGNAIGPKAIAGVDTEHGAVYTDALLLANDPRIGFATLAPVLFADITARALSEGGQFVDLDYEARQRVCIAGLAFSNPDRVVWEAGAAVPFTAFCAAANIPNATSETSAGLAVMGHPGAAPHGYKGFSYRRRLNRGRTRKGYLP
jgi:hypothetical protein